MKRYAIIIGCDEYRHYSNISFCIEDAFLMQEVLTEYCDYEYNNIELIFPTEDKERLSIESVNNDIKKILDKIESGDTLIFYFAGHGMVHENEAYLLLPDTNPKEIASTALSIKSLNELLKDKDITNFRIIDACQSGFDSRSAKNSDFIDIIKHQSWATLASCSPNELSYPYPDVGQGAFTYQVSESIKEFEPGSEINIEILKHKVCNRMEVWCKKNYKVQTPTLNSSLVGNISIATRNYKSIGKNSYNEVIDNINNNEQENSNKKEKNMNELVDVSSKGVTIPNIKTQSINLWNSPQGIDLPKRADTIDLLRHGVQLRERDLKSIWTLYQGELYENASETIFLKGIGLLRKRVLSLGVEFVGEMVGIDNPDYIRDLPAYEVINVASELGFIDKTGKIRLKSAHELVKHFADSDTEEEMSEDELKLVIRACVQYVLAYDDSHLKLEFVNFREKLKMEYINLESETIDMLVNSPYFYKKTTIRTLINLLEQTKGAEFETVVSNIMSIMTALWDSLVQDEKYFIGMKYSKYTNDGNQRYISPLKAVLVNVHGFDYVPENLRSLTFIREAKKIKDVHYAFNNFYNEPSAVRRLEKLGTRIPKPAIKECISAVLMVRLGNSYGASIEAKKPCDDILDKLTLDDWRYYLDHCLCIAEEVLFKLRDTEENVKQWIDVVNKYKLNEIELNNKYIKDIISLSSQNRIKDVMDISRKLYSTLG
ncbi:TPA: caspase family protein [Clostridioides difficile]|nr:caspase family protein [Clostridioides difficile]HBF4815702.1 caspase family protein [Clostridioides difficile]HBL6721061.1 caspase family protein [Clostridioides difficile]